MVYIVGLLSVVFLGLAAIGRFPNGSRGKERKSELR